MDSIYLICYGSSEENLQITFEKKIIGTTSPVKISVGQLIYLVIKRNGEWTVVGKANIGTESEKNPFISQKKLKPYTITNLKICKPYSINEICKSELGSSYGLVLRTPQAISAPNFTKYLADNFKTN